jgi:4-amino-4-deoxy-L-arabinose transferase-like glycosyltransferase
MRHWAVWTLLSASCAVLVHLVYLTTPLRVDEAGVSLVARSAIEDPPSLLYGRLWIDRPPLLIGLFALADAAGGAVGVRMLGVLAAAGMVCSVAWTTRRLLGEKWTAPAAVMAAALGSAPALSAHITYAELIAAPLCCAAIGCALPTMHTSTVHTRSWGIAGALAAGAPLVKQSFGDAMLALIIAAALAPTARLAVMRLTILTTGAALPVGIVLAWAVTAGPGVGPLWYAVVAFRMDAARALAEASVPLSERLPQLGLGIAVAGYVVLAPLVVRGLRAAFRASWRSGLVLAVWLTAGWVGILGGGYFWTHYMIGVAPVMVILAIYGLQARCSPRLSVGARRPATSKAIIGAFLMVHACATLVGYRAVGASSQHTTMAVAGTLREQARPDDFVLVMYARANVAYYSGMQPAFPYQWSLMYRAIPDAEEDLAAMLESSRRPTWIAQWNPPGAFGMNRDGRITAAIRRGYRTITHVCDVPIMVRRDDPRSRHQIPEPACQTPNSPD